MGDNEDENPHLQWILASIRAFRAGRLTTDGLAANIGVEAGAIEGDVPKEVREAIERFREDLEAIYWGVPVPGGIEQALIDLETTMGRFCPNTASPGTS